MDQIRVINWMRIIRPPTKANLNLDVLHRILGGKLYPGRPQMLMIRMGNDRNLQLFRGGTTQILGRVSLREAQAMRRELVYHLPKTNEDCHHLRKILLTTPMRISNMVIHAHLKMEKSLTEIAHSNENLSYDLELFPAALIRAWKPAHVAVFENGRVIITGLKSVSSCHKLLISLQAFLNRYHPSDLY